MPLDMLRLLAEQTGEQLLAVDADRLNAAVARPLAEGRGGIAVIGLHGPLTPRGLSLFGRQLVPGMGDFRAQLAQAAANPDVARIVLDVNSPGGTVAGTPETAEAVRLAASLKPVTAVVDTLAASAAYHIISQATEIAVTPSGEAGSIGVFAVHLDLSKQLEQEGVTATVIRSRTSKGERLPFSPLSDEAKAALQASVDEADTEFLKAIAKGRGMSAAEVRKMVDDNGLGRTVSARQFVSFGLADRVATMGEVLAGMIKPVRARRSSLAFA